MCLYGLSSWPLQTPNFSFVCKQVFQSVLLQALKQSRFQIVKPPSRTTAGVLLAKTSGGGGGSDLPITKEIHQAGLTSAAVPVLISAAAFNEKFLTNRLVLFWE